MPKSTYDRVVEALHGAREAISPWSYMSPTDVASNLPGGGIPQAWEASGRARDALYAGNYGQAAREYGNMAMNLVPEASPLLSLGGHLAMAAAPAFRGYHGSPNNFDAFDMARAGSTTDPGALGRGLYFSDDPHVLKGSPYGYEVDINAQNPLTLEMPDFRTRKVDVVSRHFGIDPPKTRDEMAAWSQRVADMAKERGHDAIILDNSPTGYNGKEIAVFDDSLINILKKHGGM